MAMPDFALSRFGILDYLTLKSYQMGHYIFSYAINTSKVRAIFGSADNELFNAIQSTQTFENYSSQDSDDYISKKSALEHIVFGKPYDKNYSHVYWYAFICICSYAHEGLSAAHEIKLGYETDIIKEALKNDFNIIMDIEEELFESTPSLGLPRAKDFPFAGLIQKQGLIALQEKFKDIQINDEMIEKLSDDVEKEIAYNNIKLIKSKVSFCLENDLELISFCH